MSRLAQQPDNISIMTTSKISLSIYGNRISSAGWMPEVLLNNPRFDLENAHAAGVCGCNSFYYVLRIVPEYTMYVLAFTNVKSYGASRAGALKIGISIPRGYRIQGNVSPYDVLEELKQVIIDKALTPIIGARDGYNFKQEFLPQQVFEAILEKYPLESVRAPYRPMNDASSQVGLWLLRNEQIRELFRDVQYPELAMYKQVVVANNCDAECTYARISGLEVPRQPKYAIYLNGRDITSFIPGYSYRPDDLIRFNVTELSQNPQYDKSAYMDKVMTFTIRDVKDGRVPEARVEEAMERISVAAKPEERREEYTVEITGCNKHEAALNALDVMVNGTSIAVSKQGNIVLVGQKNINPKFTARSNKASFRVLNNGIGNVLGKTITFKVEEVKIQKPVEPKPLSKNATFVYTITLEDKRDVKNYERPYVVKFRNKDRVYKERCSFTPATAKKGDKNKYAYECKFVFPMDWTGQYWISFDTDYVRYKPKSMNWVSDSCNRLEVKQNDTAKISWLKDMLRSRGFGMFALLLVVAALSALATKWLMPSEAPTDAAVEAVVELATTGQQSDNQGNTADEPTSDIDKTIADYNAKLDQIDVTFDDIEKMRQAWDEKRKDWDKDKYKESGKKLFDRLTAYVNIVRAINGANIQLIQKEVRNAETALTDKQLEVVRSIYSSGDNKNGAPVLYDGKKVKKIEAALKGKNGQATSFSALERLLAKCTNKSNDSASHLLKNEAEQENNKEEIPVL